MVPVLHRGNLMEFFGFVVPVWVLALVYVVGMPLIGYPMGKCSLKAWKYPSQYPIIGMIMFPFNSAENIIGKRENDGDGGNNVPLTMDMFNVHYALEQGVRLPIAQYLVMQMICWPLRVVFTLIASTLFFVFRQLGNLPTYGAKLLVRCEKCTKI